MNLVSRPEPTHCCTYLLDAFNYYVHPTIGLYLFVLLYMNFVIWSIVPNCTSITVLCFLLLLRFDVYNFPPQILLLPRAIVMNVNCELLYVRIFISDLVNLKSYVETVTVELNSLSRCKTRNQSQLLFSAYLSISHTFAMINPNCNAFRLSQLKFMFMRHYALI
jgi:hypothetical protein